jgi:hypothetical protein
MSKAASPSAADVFPHRVRFALNLVQLMFDNIADADDAAELAVLLLDYRNVIALASAWSMILLSVSDSSMDSQIASAACPAAPETLLMACSSCAWVGRPNGVVTSVTVVHMRD